MNVYDVDYDAGAPLLTERMKSLVAALDAALHDGATTADAAAEVGEAHGLSLSEVGFVLALAAKESK